MYRTQEELRAMLDEVKYVSQETGVNFNDILRLYEHGWKVVKTEDDIRKTMKRLLDED